MLYRILGLLIAGVITYAGWMCIGVPRFGPQLTGYFLLITGLIGISIQLYCWWEQIMNNNPFDDEDILHHEHKDQTLMYQFVINFLQPLGAVLLVTVGNIMILITGIGWLFSPKITEQLARIFMTTALTAMILIVAGVSVARW